jgi:microcin C transport system substrate-binding protein
MMAQITDTPSRIDNHPQTGTHPSSFINSIYSLLLFLLGAALIIAPASPARAARGVSLGGRLKYPAGFSHFDYTSLEAKAGGNLVLSDIGSFDKMNPFTLKGTAPEGLSSLVFETLAVRSLDEPFAMYGLIAKDIELSPDGLSETFSLNPEARFSDGSRVTADDVKFSLDTLKSDAAHPFYQSYFQDIGSAEVKAPDTVVFHFKRKNRELHLIACELPILSKAFYTAHPFSEEGLTPPIASGPYTVGEVVQGKSITYTRNPAYWGAKQPTRAGMFNFGSITYKYYKDQLVAVEAFKAHDFDFMAVNIAKQWVRDMTGPNFDNKRIIKEELPHHNDAGMQGFVMNIRRPLFQDRRVREALDLAFDFEWTNRTLFFGQYTRSNSYFSNSELAATGLPTGLELKLLEPFKEKLPPEVFTTPPTPFSTAPPNSLRKNLEKAKALLTEAGYSVKNDTLVNQAGEPFRFEILLVSPAFERVIEPYTKNLEKLGIKATYRTIDPALYTLRIKDFDFDMVVNVYGESQSPGNEQRDYWSSQAADRPGSRNLIGIKDPVVDQLVDRIIYAEKQDELVAACHALDRVLWYGYYLVPNWYVGTHRLAFWNIFAQPATLPLYYQPDELLQTWWMKATPK